MFFPQLMDDISVLDSNLIVASVVVRCMWALSCQLASNHFGFTKSRLEMRASWDCWLLQTETALWQHDRLLNFTHT
jgi:hypothetical protein